MLEIISLIMDHLPVADLTHFACVSRRMREMVYDDTRWVRRLQLIGCWNEAAARAGVEVSRRKKLEARHVEDSKNTGNGLITATSANGGPSDTKSNGHGLKLGKLQDPQSQMKVIPPRRLEGNDDDGFDFVTLSPDAPEFTPLDKPLDTAAALEVLSRARSTRGSARYDYGRIHSVLHPYYKDALRSKHPSNARIFRVYRDPVQQAQMLSQLVKFANSDITQGWQARQEKLTQMVSAFEDAVAREFEQGLKLGDVDGRMKKYAHVLVTLNGGQRAIEIFISSNPVIRDRAALGDPLDCISLNHADHLFLEESHAFFSHLSAAFNAQTLIIDRVFPTSVDVIATFVQRTGELVIATYLKTLFNHVHGKSTESYVRAVSGIYEQCLQLEKAMQPTQHSGDEFYDTINRLITDIFAPYIDTYLAEELAYFKRRSEVEVSGWERQLSQQDASLESMYMTNANRQADKRDFLTSFKKVVMMPVNVLPTFPITSRFGGKSTTAKTLANGDTLDTPQNIRTPNSTRPGTPNPPSAPTLLITRTTTPISEPPNTELAAKAAIMKSRLEGIRTLFSLEVALNLVHMAKGSIERTAVFAKAGGKFGEDARNLCELIFNILLRTLGDRHVRAGFDKAVDQLAKYNPRAASDQNQPGVAPLVMFLELVNVGDLIQQMLDVFYEQELVATKLTDRNDFLNPTVQEKKRFEQMLDERVAAGLNKGIEVLMAEVEFICATTQNVEDFNPGATGMAINNVVDVSPSNTAVWIVEVVSAHTKMLVGSTDKNMLDVFNQEVGLRLFITLCKHLKRQRVSVAGSVRLIRYASIPLVRCFQADLYQAT